MSKINNSALDDKMNTSVHSISSRPGKIAAGPLTMSADLSFHDLGIPKLQKG